MMLRELPGGRQTYPTSPRKGVAAGDVAEHELALEPLHYKACGLDNTWLLNGFAISETAYGPGVAVEDADGLHKALAHALVSDKQPITGQELRFLRKHMNLSQQGLAKLLGSSGQRIARWEKGQSGIDPAAERLVRLLVLNWLQENRDVQKALEELAEMDEAMHGRRSMCHGAAGWKRAA